MAYSFKNYSKEELIKELKKYKLFAKTTCDLDENLRNKVWRKVKEELNTTPKPKLTSYSGSCKILTSIERRFKEDEQEHEQEYI